MANKGPPFSDPHRSLQSLELPLPYGAPGRHGSKDANSTPCLDSASTGSSGKIVYPSDSEA